jgi:hypothetical protein
VDFQLQTQVQELVQELPHEMTIAFRIEMTLCQMMHPGERIRDHSLCQPHHCRYSWVQPALAY